jgi:hypothetical protein
VQPKWSKNEYNDQLQFEMTIVIEITTCLFDKYETELSSIKKVNFLKKKQLRNHKMEVEVGKQLLKQPTNLMPVHQFWELDNGPICSTSGQPFKTEKIILIS